MTRIRFASLAAACVLAVSAGSPAAVARAQQRPDFSGRWVIVQPEKSAGQEQIIKHDEKALSKTPVGDRGGLAATYQIDGVEHRNVLSMGGQQIVNVTKAAWEGNSLVLTILESYPNGMKLNVREVWSLDDQKRLVIDVTESAERQKPQVMKIVLQKKG